VSRRQNFSSLSLCLSLSLRWSILDYLISDLSFVHRNVKRVFEAVHDIVFKSNLTEVGLLDDV
jgi:hypothetical protein